MKIKGFRVATFALFLLVASSAAWATDVDAAKFAAMQERMDQMQAEMNRLRGELTEQTTGKVHEEDMRRMMKDILADAQAVPAMPKWMENLTFFGDLRLRFQNDNYGSPVDGVDPKLLSDKDRNRLRLRVRFGIRKTWWDGQLEVGFRLETDGTDSMAPYQSRSSNETLGDGFNKKRIGVNLAYMKYRPKWVEGLTLTAGKFENPFRSHTFLSWEPTITPEGLFADYAAPFFKKEGFVPWLQVGFLLLGEDIRQGAVVGGTRRDPVMWTMGMGFDWKVADDVSVGFGATYYKFNNYTETPGDGIPGSNAGGFFRGQPDAQMAMLEMTARVKWLMLDLPWEAWGTWLHNCDDTYSQGSVDPAWYNRKYKNQDNAFAMGLSVGQNKRKGDWSAGAAYYWVQGSSVAWFLTDASYGGPNVKGFRLTGKYNIDDFFTVGATLYCFDPIVTPTYLRGGNNHDPHVVSRVEFIWKF